MIEANLISSGKVEKLMKVTEELEDRLKEVNFIFVVAASWYIANVL